MSSSATQSQLTIIDTNDLYLTKDPSLNVYESKSARYTPLAISNHIHRPEQTVSGVPGETVRISLRRTGDLLKSMYLVVRGSFFKDLYPNSDADSSSILGPFSSNFNNLSWGPLAYYAIDNVQLKLNSTIVDTLYGDWMYVWTECLEPTPDRPSFKTLISQMSTNTADQDSSSCPNEFYYLPLPFWFMTHPSLALPLVALANTEIELSITFAKPDANIPILNTEDKSGNVVRARDVLNRDALQSVHIMTEEITLCQEERKWFATNPISYVITQHDQRTDAPYVLQKTVANSANGYTPNATTYVTSGSGTVIQDVQIKLDTFRLPIKQIWVGKGALHCCPTTTSAPNVTTFLNSDRMVSGAYYLESYIQNDSKDITERATTKERQVLPVLQDGKDTAISSSIKQKFLGLCGESSTSRQQMPNVPSVFSFSLDLKDNHPQGAVNFSRLKTPTLVLKGAKLEPWPTLLTAHNQVLSNYIVMAENYNVLDIRDGTAYVRMSD